MTGADFTYATSRFRGDKNFLAGVWGLAAGRDDLGSDASAYGFKIDYPNDLWDMQITAKRIGRDFDPSIVYVGSLVYLTIFATVIAFWCYLTLLGRIGPDRGAYVAVMFPVVALALSTAFEDFLWTWPALAGVALVLAGNVVALAKAATHVSAPARA